LGGGVVVAVGDATLVLLPEDMLLLTLLGRGAIGTETSRIGTPSTSFLLLLWFVAAAIVVLPPSADCCGTVVVETTCLCRSCPGLGCWAWMLLEVIRGGGAKDEVEQDEMCAGVPGGAAAPAGMGEEDECGGG